MKARYTTRCKLNLTLTLKCGYHRVNALLIRNMCLALNILGSAADDTWCVGDILCQWNFKDPWYKVHWAGWYDLPHCCHLLFPLIHTVFCSVVKFVLKLVPSPQEVPFVTTEWRVTFEFTLVSPLFTVEQFKYLLEHSDGYTLVLILTQSAAAWVFWAFVYHDLRSQQKHKTA